MNKKIHIFLFLLLGLMIFVLFKDIEPFGIEPFGNQALLQPNLSFNSRDTSIVSLQEDSEKDTSEIINNRVTPSRRIPSPVKEREVPSYSISSDTSNNLDTLSADFNSPEEIQMLNDKLDNLQSKLDEQSELFLSEGNKRKCTIPRGIYNSYRIIKDGSDGPDFEVEEGEMYAYDTFSESNGFSIRCVDEVGGPIPEEKKEITCEGTNEFFKFAGCKRTCSIPEGYVIKKNENGTDVYYNSENRGLNVDTFDEIGVDDIFCDTDNDYISVPNSDPSINGCSEGEYEFDLEGCGRIIKNCILPDDNREGGYLLNGGQIDSGGFEFNPFTKDLISDEGISCADGYDISVQVTRDTNGDIIDGGPSITCNGDEDNIVFNGCKRQCSIPDSGLPTEGYIIESEPGTPITYDPGLLFDDHFSELSIKCNDPNYVREYPSTEPSIPCRADSIFEPIGCIKRTCSIPEGYVITKNENGTDVPYDNSSGKLDYEHFVDFDSVSCEGNYRADPTSVTASSISCPDSEFVINDFNCQENITCNPPEGGVPQGYLINDQEEGEFRIIEPDDLKFNPFNNNLLNADIRCADGYDVPTGTSLTITCDTTGDIAVFSGCERQCSIPRGGLPEYNIPPSNPGDGLPEYNISDGSTSGEYDDLFDDHFSSLTITCNTADNYVEDPSTLQSITCTNNTFEGNGCVKRTCSIPEGYVITKNENGTDVPYDNSSGQLYYDHFVAFNSVSCKSDTHTSNGLDPPSSISCPDSEFVIDGFNCRENRTCNLREGVVPQGYLINDQEEDRYRMIELDDLKFNPFGDNLLNADIKCAVGYGDRSSISYLTDPSITCTRGEGARYISFNGCNKRQCSFPDSRVPEGYVANVLMEDLSTYYDVLQSDRGDIGSDELDYDFFTPTLPADAGHIVNVNCAPGYEQSGSTEPSITCNTDNIFDFRGCQKETCQFSESDREKYIIKDSNGDYIGIEADVYLDYDSFTGEEPKFLTCADNYVSYSDVSPEDGGQSLQDIINTIQYDDDRARSIFSNRLLGDVDGNVDDDVWATERSRFMDEDEASLRPPTLVEDPCYENDNIFAIDRQCIKRQCSIPIGYKITKDGNTYASGESETFDYDLDGASVECDTNYESNTPLPEQQPCGDDQTTFIFEGCNKKQCSIVNNENFNKYSFTDSIGEVYNPPLDQLLNFDHFDDQYEISCKDENYFSDGDIMASCGDNGIFQFQGCEKRTCSIPEGYMINDTYNHSSEPLDYDIFEGGADVRCRAGYISNEIDPPSSISCPDDVFSMDGYECQLIRRCYSEEEGIPEGYLINEEPNEPNGGFRFNPFTGNLYSAAVSCDVPNYIGETPTITCDANEGNVEFNGCKRQCKIPEGGVPTTDVIRGYYRDNVEGGSGRAPSGARSLGNFRRENWTPLDTLYGPNTSLDYNHFDPSNAQIRCTRRNLSWGGMTERISGNGTVEISCPAPAPETPGEIPDFTFNCRR